MAEKSAVELFDMKVAHIGINAANAAEGGVWANEFLTLMGLPIRETPVSYFNGELVEIMKENGRGTNGHIGFSVNDCEAAIRYFEERGMKSIPETKQFKEDGTCKFTYFEGEIGGFAIHILER